jgi:hypothetical protein
MIINDFYPFLDFLRGLRARVVLRNAQEATPQSPVSLHGLWLGNQEDRMADIFGRELAPLVVELHTLTQRDLPIFAIRRHLPLLGQFGNVRPRVAVNTDEIFQGWSFIEHATAALQPGKVRIPA